MHKTNWDDLRFVIAVAETGSVSQAARRLGVNHATVLRRVADFEQRHGTAIFEKTTRGYRVLADKQDVLQAAKTAEAAITTVGELASGRKGDLAGKTRLTSTDTFCQLVLPPIVARLQRRTKGVMIELISANTRADLALHQIDVTVRPSVSLPPDLEGDEITPLGFAVYTTDQGAGKWLGLSGPLSRSIGARWMAETVPTDRIVAASDSFFVLQQLIAAGCGQAILPCIMADRDPRLRRARTDAPHFTVPIWVASHVNAAASARNKALRAALAHGLRQQADALLGAPT